MSDLSPGEQKARPNILNMGGEVIWNMPNDTYMRMTPEAALNLASQLMQAAAKAKAEQPPWAGNIAKQRRPRT